MENTNVHSDIAEFFDFGEAAMPDVIHSQPEHVVPVAEPNSLCQAHGTESTDGCVCVGFMGDFEIPEATAQPADKAEWNPDFSSWIPRYSKPEQACDYCHSRHLECFITYEGQSGCSPCNALFRPCSFVQTSAEPMRQSRKRLDTLDIVTEDSAHVFGGLTAKTRPMRSLGHMGPIEDEGFADNKDTKKGSIRFPRVAIKILKDWMDEHVDHPYPTEEDKNDLKEKTGLTSSQISNWMANTRRRQKSRPKRTASPSIRPSEAINIPAGRTWESLNPFERWKHSPPENEPAPMTAIQKAVENFDPPEPTSLSSSLGIEYSRKGQSNGSSGSFSVFRAPSTTSLDTGTTNISSGSASQHSVWSHGSRNSRTSFNTFDSFGSNSAKERRRRRRVQTRPSKIDSSLANARMFQCTFCTDTFKSKYDWSRHEKSLHLSLEKWICAPLGDVITDPASGKRKCTYCDALDASRDHLETHNHASCEEKGLEARTFYRKDHLRQHLRLIHNCKMTPSMETWKSEATFIRCRCGFCGAEFTRWQDRVDHLAKEFRNGAKMKDWKGCRGLDPHVAALVTNAMPPYLIGNESKSPFPFSASNTASMAHHIQPLGQMTDLEFSIPTVRHKMNGTPSPLSQEGLPGQNMTAQLQFETDMSMAETCNISTFPVFGTPMNTSAITTPTWASNTTTNSNVSPSSNPKTATATCWEILTLRLGRFVRQKMVTEGPGSCTDELIQSEARRILYNDDDPWNQTAADNPEWLALFKKAHGIVDVPDNFDVYDALEDCGVNIHNPPMETYSILGSNTIPELDYNGKGEPALDGSTNMGLNLDLGTVNECFKYPGWGQIAEIDCEEAHPQIMDGDAGELELFNWDEAMDGAVFNDSAVFNMGCGA
ncbi:uncharacterized protein BDZ99DRAFT_518149 [Mytilinidion resinicola]|uniref:Homeobox and C2H2 transcription factor n=1 Tax=Mytilinidion resinicola TaxID=574789 RepID=A0A6A6YU33_9PEZI|nr:uncharacterized protein BDZ99DRAFT_518149 [Mytilinidion resinicola]KAF2812291.1 hypothetical protein BDZ99DRAFT_518149 [Mytilinidion resinicola]